MDAARVQWIEEIGAEWNANPARAAVLARLDPERLDAETLAYVASAVDAATRQMNQDRRVRARGASLGFYADSNGALEARVQQLTGLRQMLEAVAGNGGDPPARDELRACALDVLQGKRTPADAVVLGADDPRAAAVQMAQLLQFAAMNGTDLSWVARVGHFNAAMALPRVQLLALAGREAKTNTKPADPVETARRDVARILREADALRDADPAKAEAMLLDALAAADVTPETSDDVDALLHLLLLVGKHKLADDTVRQCVARVAKLAQGGVVGDHVATLATMLAGLVAAGDLSQELDAPLAEAGGRILAGELTGDLRVRLTAAVARGWLRAGRTHQADRALRALRKRGLSAAERLDLACVEADVLTAGGDRAAAADALVEALDAAAVLSFDERKAALQALVCLWPAERAGGEWWTKEYDDGAASMDEPFQTLARMTLVLALQKSGDVARGLAYGRRIDMAELRRQLPRDFAAMADEMESGFRSTMEALETAAKDA